MSELKTTVSPQNNFLAEMNNDQIKLQVFLGSPYQLIIYSTAPLINCDHDGYMLLNYDTDVVKITEDSIELKLHLKKKQN